MYKYSEVREQIQTGDILVFKISKKAPLASYAVKIFDGTDIYHVGFAVWLSSPSGSKRLFIVESARGNRQIVPLSNYEGERIDVYTCPIDFNKIESSILDNVGKVKYSYPDLLSVWMRERLNIRFFNFDGEICSEMVAKYLHIGGFEFDHIKFKSRLVSPKTIVESLEKAGFNPRLKIGE